MAVPKRGFAAMEAEGLTTSSTVRLHGGTDLPVLGLGLSHNGGYSEDAVVAALNAGCNLLDTAARYGTEACIPKAVKRSNRRYEDITVTTKLWPAAAGDIPLAINKSLRALDREQHDLYLIHWPQMEFQGLRAREARAEAWRQLERAQEAGVCKSIGVSNFELSHMEQILEDASTPPAINQIEVHPYQHPKELIDLCQGAGVVVQAYSPFAKGAVFIDARLADIASKYTHADGTAVTPAQVTLRWLMQKDIVTIPKSTDPRRAVANARVFDFVLSERHMRDIDTYHTDMRVTWDPTFVE